MTRAFTPPETLSDDDIRTIANVRRDIWSNAFYGMGVGILSGAALHGLGSLAQSRGMIRGLNRNTAFMSVLGGGALGSFLMATVTGKNQVHNLHPIFEVGKRQVPPPDQGTPYQQAIQRAQQESLLDDNSKPIMITRTTTKSFMEEDFDLDKRRENRLMRRRTLQDRFETKGGNWQ